MEEFEIIQRIQALCEARSWSYYRLVKESGISTLRSTPCSIEEPPLQYLHYPAFAIALGLPLLRFSARRIRRRYQHWKSKRI